MIDFPDSELTTIGEMPKPVFDYYHKLLFGKSDRKITGVGYMPPELPISFGNWHSMREYGDDYVRDSAIKDTKAWDAEPESPWK